MWKFAEIRRFIENERGSISMMSVIVLLLLIVMAGGALDMSNLYKDKNYNSNLADNAVLAAASEFKRARRGATGRNAASALVSQTAKNFKGGKEFGIRTDFKRLNGQQYLISSTVSGTTEHAFLGIIGLPESKVSSSATSLVNLVEAEVILVLDVSHSMIKGTLLADMKEAAKSFVTDLDPYDGEESYISFTILPFAETVNMGPESNLWLHPSDGLDYAPDFIGCFRHSDGRSVGSLQGYPVGDTPHAGKIVPYCPPPVSAALLNSSDEAELTAYIDGLDVGLGTGSDTGLLWAERMLTKSWRDRATFASTPYKALNNHTQKFIVFLTDGELVRGDEDQNGLKGLQNSDDVPSYSVDVEASFVRQCQSLQADDSINVFMIGYSVSGSISQNLTGLLENCTSGTGLYYPAGSYNISEIFASVRGQIQDVYLTD